MIAREEAGRLLGVFAGNGGVGFSFEAVIDGMRAEGVVSDPESGGQLPMRAERGEDGIRMVIYSMADSGEYVPVMDLSFARLESGEAVGTGALSATGDPDRAGQDGTGQGASAGRGGTDEPLMLDSNLVGTWRHSQSSSDPSFGFSMVVQYTLRISPDGTYVQTSSSAGGGSGVTVGGGGEQVSAQGRWQTRDKVLWLDEGAGWRPFARYLVDSGNMMFIFGDDARQLWERVW